MINRLFESALADNESLSILTDSVRHYCEDRLDPRRLRTLREKSLNFDLEIWREMVAAGWSGISLSEDNQGLGLGPQAFAIVNYELGRVVAAEPILETATVAASLLSEANNASKFLDDLLNQNAIYSSPIFARPSDSLRRCSAAKDGEEFQLNGSFEQIPIAADAEFLIIPAELAGELNLFVIRAESPGLRIEPVLLADQTRDGRVNLDNVRCDAQARLEFDDLENAYARSALASAIGASAYMLGLSNSLLQQTLTYLCQREQFGQPIGSFQSLQHRAVDWYLQLRLCASSLTEAVEASVNNGASSSLIERTLARAEEMTRLSAREAIQMHGAIGYTLEYDLALYVQRGLVMAARYSFDRRQPATTDMSFGLKESTSQGSNITRDVSTIEPEDGNWNTLDDETFRLVVRKWITDNYPEELRHYPGQVRWAEIKTWHQALLQQGWVAPAWPREHGGMALEPSKLLIYVDEMENHGVARAPDQGIVMIGPVLMSYGTEAQREHYLEPSLTGEYIWCQGYSEPNAGSDLASLNTSAELIDGEFVVNGHKIWTTHGLDATHMYCLVRTDTKVKPQAGISFLLIDLNQPGITVRAIPNLSGDVDFCEVFLENVRVPEHDLVGELNNGWTIAKALLGHERLFVGSPKLCRHALSQLHQTAGALDLMSDPVFLNDLRAVTRDVFDLEALYTEFAEQIKRGESPSADVAILKIGVTETYAKLSEMLLAAAGPAGGVHGRVSINDCNVDVLSHYYNARPAPIYAGSNEIQRNIVAKQILGLPS